MSDPRVALVTGASRGIGRAVAERLAADGLQVVGTATTEAGAQGIAAALGERGHGVVLRLEEPASVEEALGRIEDWRGPPLVLVNNAGIARDGLLMRMSADAWDAVVGTNLGGVYRLTRPVLRSMMRARWGRIVNLSSVVGRMGNAGQTNYAAAKAGIEGFTRALAREVGSRGITVNAVAPGFHRYGHDLRAGPGAARRHGRGYPPRPDGNAGGRRGGRPRSSSGKMRPTSPARPCTSTADCTWPEPCLH